MPELHHHTIDKLAAANGVVSGIALFPQVYTALVMGNTDGLSLLSFSLIFSNNIVWLAYSVHRRLVSVAIASMLNLIASGLLVSYMLVG